MTTERTSQRGRERIESSLGNPELSASQVAEIQSLIEDSGALAECESLIETLLAQSLEALGHPEMNEEVAQSLSEMALAATRRKS
jgi:geranylgeranyl diphosphate synthase type I